MKKIVQQAIERIYLKKDYSFFNLKCLEPLGLSDDFYELLSDGENYDELSGGSIAPSLMWYVYFKTVVKGDFKVEYTTMLEISKVAPVFHIQHQFMVDNEDPNRVSPDLDGFSGQAYSKSQFELHEKISKYLINQGYFELTYAEMNEVVCGLEMPKGIKIFGSQITVETALFRDVFEICPNE